MSGGYTPVFNSVLDGTLFGRWPHTGVWLCLLSQCDKYGVIDMVPKLLAAKIGVSEEELRECIRDFMAPDPGSRTGDREGRRLELIDPDTRDWGWRVINHGSYRERARKAAYDAERKDSGADAERKRKERESRAKQPSREVPRSPAKSRAVPLSDSDTNTDTDSDRSIYTDPSRDVPRCPDATRDDPRKVPRETPAAAPAEFLDFKIAYPERAGDQGWRKAQRAAHARLAEGHTWHEMIDGARRYAAFVELSGNNGTEYVKQAATFLGPDLFFLEPWDAPKTKADLQLDANLKKSKEWLNAH